MDENKELLMQKHNNIHKTLCGLWVSWSLFPLGIAIKFKDFGSFLNTDTIKAIVMALLLLVAYLAVTWTFYYKCNEYEHLIKHHCSACESVT